MTTAESMCTVGRSVTIFKLAYVHTCILLNLVIYQISVLLLSKHHLSLSSTTNDVLYCFTVKTYCVMVKIGCKV